MRSFYFVLLISIGKLDSAIACFCDPETTTLAPTTPHTTIPTPPASPPAAPPSAPPSPPPVPPSSPPEIPPSAPPVSPPENPPSAPPAVPPATPPAVPPATPPPTPPATPPGIPPSIPTAIQPTCGYSMYNYNSDEPGIGIVGGTEASQNEYPSIVYVFIVAVGKSLMCGGTIISENYVLSAAHCFDGSDIKRVVVTIADHNRVERDDGQFSMEITNYRLHENFDSLTNDYDFALLKLPFPLNFTVSWKWQKACLHTDCNDGTCQEGTSAYVAGWGQIAEGGYTSNILKHATVEIVNTETCRTLYWEEEGLVVTDYMFCAGYDEGGIDSCSGDSGGPLYTKVNGKLQLCGVTSWGRGCARPKRYGVYAKVCAVMDWIRKHSDVP